MTGPDDDLPPFQRFQADAGNTPLRDETLAVRAGFTRSSFNEHAEPIMATSSFVFDSAAQAFRTIDQSYQRLHR